MQHLAPLRDPHLNQLRDMGVTLASDYDFCQCHLQGIFPKGDPAERAESLQKNGQFWRRAMARTVCAYVEGVSALMRDRALEFEMTERRGATKDKAYRAKIAALLGESYSVDEKGHAHARELLTPTLSNVVFSFNCYAEVFASPFRLDKGGQGWQALQKAFKIRNRLMHPKRPSDLEVSDDELHSVREAFCFFHNSLAFLFDGSAAVQVAPNAAL